MKASLKSYFVFTRSQRAGLCALAAIVVALQLVYCFADFSLPVHHSLERQQWLALQPEIDSLKKQKAESKPAIYPFNPNFITDFKGYQLGMSVAEIDRLHALRKKDKYVNSAEEFQEITKVSDSLLAVISPYFKFPDWVTKRKAKTRQYADYRKSPMKKISVIDINTATKEDLMAVYGIGPAFSDRILKMKEQLGGFVSMAQMEDVWGLSPEVIEKLNGHFKVTGQPAVRKIAVNEMSLKELSQFPYFRYAVAKEIVTHRSMHGRIKDIDDLKGVRNFPLDKIGIIAVYLEF